MGRKQVLMSAWNFSEEDQMVPHYSHSIAGGVFEETLKEVSAQVFGSIPRVLCLYSSRFFAGKRHRLLALSQMHFIQMICPSYIPVYTSEYTQEKSSAQVLSPASRDSLMVSLRLLFLRLQ